MNVKQMKTALATLVANKIKTAVMIWGPPGVGKSSIVGQVAQENGLQVIDLRLSQLAPTDLRGLPVPNHGDGTARWYPPEFLPQSGTGILFLDELNMAPPTMQGVAQQLILDRRVGSYELPDGWFVWAAGNRKEDRAAISTMPAPLANRFIHLQVEADLGAFTSWGNTHGVDPLVLGFLRYRPNLLHRFEEGQMAWPSPRSWVEAGKLHAVGLDPAWAVGDAPAAEFKQFVEVFQSLPDLELVVNGLYKGELPTSPDARYAIISGVVPLINTADQLENAAAALKRSGAQEDWAVLMVGDVVERLQAGLVDIDFSDIGPTLQRMVERTMSL